MDETTRLLLAFLLGLLAPYIRKLLEFGVGKCLAQVRKVHEGRNHRKQIKNDAEQAVRRALESWDYAEKYREVKTNYVQAYGGYHPTVLDEIECWEDVVVKCKKAVTALELINENDRARDFSRNVLIASKKMEALRSHSNEDNTRTLVLGINEAKRRELDAKLVTNNCEVLNRIARESGR